MEGDRHHNPHIGIIEVVRLFVAISFVVHAIRFVENESVYNSLVDLSYLLKLYLCFFISRMFAQFLRVHWAN